MEKKIVGAGAAAVVSAGSIDTHSATARHTEGPWWVEGEWENSEGRGWSVEVGDPLGSIEIAFLCQTPDRPNAEADARLIAAAPDYHEAMQNALLDAGELEGDDAGYVAITVDAWHMLKAAHAKAERSLT